MEKQTMLREEEGGKPQERKLQDHETQVKKNRKNAKQTIQGQIQANNRVGIAILLLVVILSTVNLLLVDRYQIQESHYSGLAESAGATITTTYEWLNQINLSLSTHVADGIEIDPERCSFAQWLAEASKTEDARAKAYIDAAKEAHRGMHRNGEKVVSHFMYGQAYNDMTGSSNALIRSLEELRDYYKEKAEKCHDALVSRIIWAIITNVVLAVAATILTKRIGNKLSKRISHPIKAVAKWSEELSLGATDLEFDDSEEIAGNLIEIERMVSSFSTMANGIRENIKVVQKVAAGDMTAFVNIRSASDSLGRNLYNLVQSNDIMFAEITDIANAVAERAVHISATSTALADSCSVQAEAVQRFTEMLDETSGFIEENNQQAENAIRSSETIHQEIVENTQKMSQLLLAMEDIRQASGKVSAIIKTINDIASQTNLLALNASIEAARAGEAGKGFAVVAEEVKELAAKSAMAAEESKHLIEDTISKTEVGNTISNDTAQTFEQISSSVNTIVEMIRNIADAGVEQQSQIQEANKNILSISEAITGNAASSQETSAASTELSESAEELKSAMMRFTLRKREPGKPYIPPEKRNDPEFIRQAEENYRKAKETGRAAL